jgi:hypothetical protein
MLMGRIPTIPSHGRFFSALGFPHKKGMDDHKPYVTLVVYPLYPHFIIHIYIYITNYMLYPIIGTYWYRMYHFIAFW